MSSGPLSRERVQLVAMSVLLSAVVVLVEEEAKTRAEYVKRQRKVVLTSF
jgi:hypothetical protein